MVMQGYGGLLPAGGGRERAVGMIECGPAAGVIGSRVLGRLARPARHHRGRHGRHDLQGRRHPGRRDRIRARADGRPLPLHRAEDRGGVDRRRRRLIVPLEPGTQRCRRSGRARAGARPGPVCYGLGGTEPTLTDVMHADRLHGSGDTSWAARMRLDRRRAPARVFEDADRRAAWHVGRGGGHRHLSGRRAPRSPT